MQKIILASQSQRRKQLLEWAEVPFKVVISNADESFDSNIPVDNVPVSIAEKKAIYVQKKINDANAIILAADTLVILNDVIIGKPADKNMLLKHYNLYQVLHIIRFSDVTEVVFNPLTNEQIEFYIDKYKPYDKAGAYAIQEWIGVIGIKSINGDFYNVMGLPVSKVVQQLNKLM